METYTGSERLVELLADNGYQNGFERETPLSEPELQERRLLLQGCVSIGPLRRHAYKRYWYDTNLARYTWQVLLRSGNFFEDMYPGFHKLRGRECNLDIVHIATGQERGKWLANGGSLDALLDVNAWAIGIASLQNQHHKLYVHDDQPDGLNLCRDGFGHRHFAYQGTQLDRCLAKAEATVGLETWRRQAGIQGVNPCIYSVIQGWILTLPTL